MDFRLIAIDTGRDKREIHLNTLSAEEFVDFAKGNAVANVKSVTGGLGTTLSSFSLRVRNLSPKSQRSIYPETTPS